MALYEMTAGAFRPLAQSSFFNLKVKERGDLQRLLRTQIDVLGDDLYVLAEEFGDWEDKAWAMALARPARSQGLLMAARKP